MAQTSITLTPQFGDSSVITINCGSSSPKLSGTVDISSFTNIRDFRCNNHDIRSITGYEDKVTLTALQFWGNRITGSFPNISALSALQSFRCDTNLLTGTIPSLSSNVSLNSFIFGNNAFTGSIPILSSTPSLVNFIGDTNFLTGNIPNLNGITDTLTALQIFNCRNNQLVGFNGGIVSPTLGEFQVQNNLLTTSAVDAILSSFTITNRTSGTRILNLGGTGNAAPSYTGGVTTNSPGSNFTRSGTTVTANVVGHGHTNGDIVTIDGLFPTALHGTFVITVNNLDQFQYTTLSSGVATGTGTATMRRTTNPSDGYASYQNLALVSRTGGPWNITINQPS